MIRPKHSVTIAGTSHTACMDIAAIDAAEEAIGYSLTRLVTVKGELNATTKQMAQMLDAATKCGYEAARAALDDDLAGMAPIVGRLLSDVLAPSTMTEQAIADAGGGEQSGDHEAGEDTSD
jgi:hypothetical protein